MQIQEKTHQSSILLAFLLLVSSVIIYGYLNLQGNYFIYLDVGSDTMHSFYPIYRFAASCLREWDFSQWSFAIGTGATTFNYTSVMMDPFAWPVILAGAVLGDQVIAGLLVYMQVVKVLACGLVCLRFLRWHGITGLPGVIGAYAYGMNGFLMLWGQHYWLGTAVFWIITFLTLLEKALHEKRYNRWFALVTGLVLMQSVYVGYMILLFAAIYALLRIWYLHGHLAWKEWWKIAWPAIASVLVGVMISMATVLPNAYLILGVSGRVGGEESLWQRIVECIRTPFTLGELKTIVLRFFTNNAQGVGSEFQLPGYQVNYNYYEAVQLFFSVFLVILAPVWFVCRIRENIPKHQKGSILVATGLVGLLIIHPLGAMMFNAFAYPFGRYTFLLMPLFAIVLAAGVRYVYLWKKWSVWVILPLVGLNMTWDGFVTTNQRGLAAKELSWVSPEEHQEMQRALTWLELQDDTLYRVEKTYWAVSEVMDSVALQYNGISGYNSMIGPGVSEFYEKCWPELLVAGSTMRQYFTGDPYAWEQSTFLGVKYLLAKPEEQVPYPYEEIARQDDLVIYRNVLVENIGFLTESYFTDGELDAMEPEDRQTALAQMCREQVGQVTLYEGKDQIQGHMVAEQDATLVITVPKDYGWTVYLDGVLQEPESAAYGYMALAVSQGRHEILLTFAMPGASLGCWLSLTGVALWVGICLYQHRKEKKV